VVERPAGECWGARADLAELGCGEAGLKRKRREGSKRKGFSFFFKHTQTMNSNKSLNSNTQKRCTSMYATVNSYISLIN
jgi:hypothetical protein